ncbi:retrovirus-related pol polyprotein from transposon TNT 1-94 [Tanacetum coccineum]
MFRINPFKHSRVNNFEPNKHVRASIRTKPITTSQPHASNKKYANSNLNGLSCTRVESTTRRRRPQPRINRKNDRVLSASKSSYLKNNEEKVEEHHRNLLSFNNLKHMSSKCNNIKLAIQNDKSEVMCGTCYRNLFMVRRLGLFQAYDQESKATHQLRLELYGNYLEGKSKKTPHKPKPITNTKNTLHLLHMDLCGLMRVESMHGNRYVLVIMDDNSRYTWVHLLKSKDEAPKVIIKFLKQIQVLLQAPVIIVRTENGTELTNQVLKAYLEDVSISHQTSTVRTPQQNRVVEQRNRTLVEATRTMLIFSSAPLFLWTDVVATACYTQNRSLIHKIFNKTPNEYINNRKLDISFLYVFGALCYPKNDREDIRKLSVKDATRTAPAAPATLNPQTLNASITTARTAPTPTNSSTKALSNYVIEILKKHGMEHCDPIGTPMDTKNKLDLDTNGTYMDAMRYRRMIGSLMYLTSSRPDIVHNTCLCARYQARPTEKHLKEVKRSFHYLWGTANMGLWYTNDSGFELSGFLDTNHAGCQETFKSTSRGTQFLGEKLSAIAISYNPVEHSRTKHIAVRYHFIKEHAEKGKVELYFVKTDYQLADIFTKALLKYRFDYLVCFLGMRSFSPQERERLAKSK